MPPEKNAQTTVGILYAPLLDVGGVETHLLSLLRHSDHTLYRWLIIASTSPIFKVQAEALGAQVIPWQPAHILDGKALIHLVCLLRVQPIDLLHVHSPRASLLGRIAARLAGLPVIVTAHLPPYYFVYGQNIRARFKRCIYRWVEKTLNYGLTDQLIYVSARVCQEALALGLAPRGRTIVIENGIDLTSFANEGQSSAVREALGTPPQATVLCCVGRLDKQKGIDVLLEAASKLESEKQTCVWLVGDGPQRAALEIQARQLGLDAHVRFLGFRDDVPDLLKASNIFVLPSRYEAMPITILEAMAAGLASVVTDVGENAHLIEDGVTGRIVPPEDPQALADALRALIQNPSLCGDMGGKAKTKAQQYGVERMVARTLGVYERVLHER